MGAASGCSIWREQKNRAALGAPFESQWRSEAFDRLRASLQRSLLAKHGWVMSLGFADRENRASYFI